MEIKGKVHCFFEQSGTFKNEFKKFGYEAYDYDIQNNFGETDYIIDLFKEIESAYDRSPSVFDKMSSDDLIIAFFPCIYFETAQQLYYALSKHELQKKPKTWQIDYAINRLKKRTEFHLMLYKLIYIFYDRNFRAVIENPATTPNYLITGQNFPKPTFIDRNRLLRGDFFKKPTAYWFFNCEPTSGLSIQSDKKQKIIDNCKRSPTVGLCSEERSAISPDYAKNFICDFILGRQQKNSQMDLFEKQTTL